MISKSSIRFLITLSRQDYAKLRTQAAAQGKPAATLARQYLEAAIKTNNAPPPTQK